MRSVILASCAELPESNGDDTQLPEALAEVGVRAWWSPWDDHGTDFQQADLVVLRATWDYASRRDEFLAWCDAIPALANPAHVVRWNTDKRYLVELAEHGVPVVPVELVDVGGVPDWPEGEFVLKPSVGAGSRGAARFDGERLAEAGEHLAELHQQNRPVLLQPYQETVDRFGETALVFFGGMYSHAFRKGPMLARPSTVDSSGLYVTEGLSPDDPDPDLRRAAEDVMDAAAGVVGLARTDLLYARVDLVRDADGVPLLLELEVSEPSLGFRQTDAGAQLRFASAVRSLLSR